MIILRYELRVGANELELPVSALPVHVGAKIGDIPDRVHLWVSVSDGYESEPRQKTRFYVAATGESVSGTYIGTALVEGGRFVWHVFDMEEA